MAQVDDVNAKLDEAVTKLDNLGSGLTQLKTDLDKTLADLAAKIAAGASPTDLTATLAKAQAVADKIDPLVAALGSIDGEVVAADA